MLTDDIRKGIQQRASVDDEWDYGVQQSWKYVLSIISQNPEGIISFLENDCTGEELSWLSEIFNEIIDIFPNHSVIDILRKTADKYPVETEKYNIQYCIDEAESHLFSVS